MLASSTAPLTHSHLLTTSPLLSLTHSLAACLPCTTLSATVRDLHYEFDRYGRISDIWIARNPPGFAFIDFEDDRDARDAG